jgi:hypothetical protein
MDYVEIVMKERISLKLLIMVSKHVNVKKEWFTTKNQPIFVIFLYVLKASQEIKKQIINVLLIVLLIKDLWLKK